MSADERGAPRERRESVRETPAEGDGPAMDRLTRDVLPALIARFEASAMGELEIRRGAWHVRLRKPVNDPADADPVPAPTPATSARARGAAKPGGDGNGRPALLAPVGPGRPRGQAGAPAGSQPIAVSPAVGFFVPLGAAAPGAVVRAGDLLGHVDVLGVRQEVVAPADGVVGRVLAISGEPVEYGQELVRLEAARVADGKAHAGSAGASDEPGTDGPVTEG